MTVTSIDATSAASVTAWPSGTARPATTDLRMEPGQVRRNLVIAQVGRDGRVLVAPSAGSTAVLVDAVGYYR